MEKVEKYKILYVDDDEGNLNVFKASFLREYQVLVATSGEEALDIIKKHPDIVLVISDQRMPGISGIDLLKEIATTHPDILRIIITAYSDIEVAIRATNECQIYKYLTKPWDLTELRLIIKNAIEVYELRKENKNLMLSLQKANTELIAKVEELEALSKELTMYSLHLVQKNEKIKEIKQLLQQVTDSFEAGFRQIQQTIQSINSSLRLDQDWESFMIYFEKVNINFFQNLKTKFPDLSSGEMKLCALIRLGLANKQISDILNISPQSVNVARYRLRKKLNLSNEQSLDDFIIQV
ncbi:MAG: response regulator [Bacteroidia bacterium]|nr:response regulator [Bacteroidia bacterium]MDW8159564.1 response regulator [Bacteroidia bacterium]